MAKKKKANTLVRLISTGEKTVVVDGETVKKKTGYFYVLKKNPRLEKKTYRKYDPVIAIM